MERQRPPLVKQEPKGRPQQVKADVSLWRANHGVDKDFSSFPYSVSRDVRDSKQQRIAMLFDSELTNVPGDRSQSYRDVRFALNYNWEKFRQIDVAPNPEAEKPIIAHR